MRAVTNIHVNYVIFSFIEAIQVIQKLFIEGKHGVSIYEPTTEQLFT